MATSVDALQRTGARGVLAGLPMLNDATTFLQGKISEDLEQQDVNRSMLIAQGEERIRQVREAREIAAIQGLGNQSQVGRQDAASATTNFATSLLALGDSIDDEDTSFDQAQRNNFVGSLGSKRSFIPKGGLNSFLYTD
jgi:LPS O-antigen subunit length determinant protein (WzzB/FepE family)